MNQRFDGDKSGQNTSPEKVTSKKNWEKFDDDGNFEEISMKRDGNEKIVINKPETSITETTVDLYVKDENDGKNLANTNTTSSGSETKNNAEVINMEPLKNETPKKETKKVVIQKDVQAQVFSNGDVIVNLYPVNEKWPWITPAVFRPELVPEELMAQQLTLTIEEYVDFMQILVSDSRFKLYNMFYKRVLGLWIVLAFVVLMSILLSGIKGILLFTLGIFWLFINACAIFFCIHLKIRITNGLEKCMLKVNKNFIKHKILLVSIDRGHISCHKVNLHFLYYDSAECIEYLNRFILSQENANAIKKKIETWLEPDKKGSSSTETINYGEIAFLRYSQRWGSEALKGLIDVSGDNATRHCIKYTCVCKYIEDYFKTMEDYPCKGCIGLASDHIYAY